MKISRRMEDILHWWFGPNSLWAKIGLPPYKKPERVTVTICRVTEELARDTCILTGPKEYLKGEEPKVMCHLHEKITVTLCAESQMLHNPWCKEVFEKSFYTW